MKDELTNAYQTNKQSEKAISEECAQLRLVISEQKSIIVSLKEQIEDRKSVEEDFQSENFRLRTRVKLLEQETDWLH